MLRDPSARGPNSIRPLNQPMIFSSASRPGYGSKESGPVVPLVDGPFRAEDLLDLFIRRKGLSRSTRPFATQFRATPPARQRFSNPVSRCDVRTIRSMTSSHTT